MHLLKPSIIDSTQQKITYCVPIAYSN